jgi:hypothetical protein
MYGKGWNTILRLYSPLEPFFTKEWRLSEIELSTDTKARRQVNRAVLSECERELLALLRRGETLRRCPLAEVQQNSRCLYFGTSAGRRACNDARLGTTECKRRSKNPSVKRPIRSVAPE